MKKLSVSVYVNMVLSILFTLLCLSFHADISLVAFPLSLVFTGCIAYFVCFRLVKKHEYKLINPARKLYQYQPFVYLTAFVLQRAGKYGKSYALDLITVIVWVAVTASSFVILHYLSEKRVFTLNKEWEKLHKDNPEVKYHGLKRVGIEAVEWLDALVQAVYTIVLINIFLFQLYEIPSESMVPEFLIKDRVAVFKTLSGPKFPLSDVGLPYLRKYNRGDIVVLRNPHYKNDRQSEVKTFVSSFVYMATLTLVKMNKDENGELKADPLVKRLVGLPGEQLMMMDGSLYSRTKNSSQFTKLTDDEKWAAWDLNNLSSKTKAKIMRIPLSTAEVEMTQKIEEERRTLDLQAAAFECQALANQFSRYATGGNASDSEMNELFTGEQMYEYNMFKDNVDNTIKLLSVAGGREWFNKFMTSWQTKVGPLASYKEEDGVLTGDSLVGGDLYTDSNFRLNVMTKLLIGRLMVRNAELIQNNESVSKWNSDKKRISIINDAQEISEYIYLLDQRNMPVFPANDADGNAQYIPDNCYFMMGDNRYNSLDMRHSYDETLIPLTKYDDMAVEYYSNMAPQFVSRSLVLGKASYRFWPLDRAGVPGKDALK